MAAVELLTMTANLTRLIVEGASTATLSAAARADGMRSLWSSGVARVLSGETTPAEVARVLDSEANTDGDDTAANFESQPEWQDLESMSRNNTPYSDQESRSNPIIARAPVAPMTRIEVGVVDVYLVDPQLDPWRVLALHRAPGTSRGGTWEAVHGKIESEEVAQDAALREVLEETGLVPQRLYNVTVHSFYLHKTARIEVAVVFCAFVDSGSTVRIGPEHSEYAWLNIEDAPARFTWPRAGQALAAISKLLAGGDAGAAEDVLRVL